MKPTTLIILIAILSSCATTNVHKQIERADYSQHVLMREISRKTGEERQFPDYYERQPDTILARSILDRKLREKDSLVGVLNGL